MKKSPKNKKTEKMTCRICLSDLSGPEITEECGHSFHLECRKKDILLRSLGCPLCKGYPKELEAEYAVLDGESTMFRSWHSSNDKDIGLLEGHLRTMFGTLYARIRDLEKTKTPTPPPPPKETPKTPERPERPKEITKRYNLRVRRGKK